MKIARAAANGTDIAKGSTYANYKSYSENPTLRVRSRQTLNSRNYFNQNLWRIKNENK